MPIRHIHNVYTVHTKDNKVNRHLAGRFLTAGDHLHVLEDYGNHLGHLKEGPLDMENLHQIHDLYNSQYLDVVNQQELENGKRPDLLPEAQLDPMPPKKPPSFEYVHNGTDQADSIEFKDGVPHYNGVPTTHLHVNALLDNVKSGLGIVRYKKDQGAEIKKMEAALSSLMKADEDLSAAFSRLRELVASGHLDPKHERILAGQVYKDALVPELGNQFGYHDFLSRPTAGGVHVMMDGNDFRSVNNTYGHPIGDAAIKAMGKAIRESVDETMGSDKAKAFRVGGDEFAIHAPDHESAAKFARAVRTKLEAIPAIGGSHKLSMSFGLGADPKSADTALYEAKKQKYTPETVHLPEDQRERAFSVGGAPSFAHSLVPGSEGAIPLDQSQLNVKPVPAPIKEPLPEPAKPAAGAPAPSAPAPVQPPKLA